jgi:hypothetical protein
MLLEKVRADLLLLDGDPDLLRSMRLRHPTPNVEAEAAFRAALSGKRVIIVGPSPYTQPSAEQLRSADVVVTTRLHHVELEPGQISIAYITDETARQDSADLHADLDRHADHLVVLRPSILRRPIPTLVDHDCVRTMQFDDSTPFLGTHFGVQRILYDLLGSDPVSIMIAGVDFFVGADAYQDGYRPEPDWQTAAPRLNFSHDYAYEFEYTQHVLASGLVGAVPSVAEILRQSVTAYLTQLGLQHSGPTPGTAL